MKINIYTAFNGVGLEKDYKILKELFESWGHSVDYSDWKNRTAHRPAPCDLAIHLEIARADLFGLSKRNVLMPNPEWFDMRWANSIRRFEAVWCKTKDCLKIFSKYHKNCIYTGFTSLDFYTDLPKSMQLIHVQGASEFKGTHEILTAYGSNDLPKLFVLSKKELLPVKNVVYGGFLPKGDFEKLINICLVHLCPSYYEGFGHYLNEAFSCGCVVLTTDAPPMNEFISDKRFLVPVASQSAHHLGTLYRPDINKLAKRIKSISEMDVNELKAIGLSNREKYLTNHYDFVNRLKALL